MMTLGAHCARCHQADRLQEERPGNLLLNILDLDEIARDPSLVRPGVADASPLYTIMLRQAMPPAQAESVTATGTTAPTPGPSDEEVQAVRDWINSLPPQPSSRCGQTKPADDSIATALSRLQPTVGADTRFIILPCTVPGSQAERERTIQQLIQDVAPTRDPVKIDALDPAGSLYSFSLAAAGLTTDDWEKLTADYPDRDLPASPAIKLASGVTSSAVAGVRADWLAHWIIRGRLATEASQPAREIIPLAPLARAWERDLDLSAAAAELALDREELEHLLLGISKTHRIPARRLLQGLLSRTDFMSLRATLLNSGNTAGTSKAATKLSDQPFSFEIWSNRVSYRIGDLLMLNAATDTDCHLTLIGLDADGRAIVLFPNEIVPDNLLKAGSVLSVPAAEAGYQFRLDKPGTETVIGVCTVDTKIADNIQQDFDRQRFTLLGDWRGFLAQTWTRAAAPARQQTDRRRRRGRVARRNTPPVPAKIERPKPQHHARTAITFEVK